MGLRNLTRRKWNTVLVVLGSMVGTALISGSLVLGDSTGRFQENEARQTLGEIDEVVGQAGQRLPSDRRPKPLFDASVADGITPEAVRELTETDEEATGGVIDRVSGALRLREGPAGVDGVLGALTGEVPAESLNNTGETVVAVPAITVVGTDWEELGSFGEEPPPVAERSEPGPGELYAWRVWRRGWSWVRVRAYASWDVGEQKSLPWRRSCRRRESRATRRASPVVRGRRSWARRTRAGSLALTLDRSTRSL
jgi:hypothetical protein